MFPVVLGDGHVGFLGRVIFSPSLSGTVHI